MPDVATRRNISRMTTSVNNLVEAINKLLGIQEPLISQQRVLTKTLNKSKVAYLENAKAIRGETTFLEKHRKGIEHARKVEEFYARVKQKNAEKNAAKNKEEEETVAGITKRTKIFNKTLAALAEKQGVAGKEQAKFNLGLQSYSEYLKQGGSRLEYFALMMTSGSEQVRAFGMEAIGLRRIMYGFLPRGTFRAVNQLATSFNFVGGTLRGTKNLFKENNDEMDKTQGAFKKMLRLTAKPLFVGLKTPKQRKAKREEKEAGEKARKRAEMTGGEYFADFQKAFRRSFAAKFIGAKKTGKSFDEEKAKKEASAEADAKVSKENVFGSLFDIDTKVIKERTKMAERLNYAFERKEQLKSNKKRLKEIRKNLKEQMREEESAAKKINEMRELLGEAFEELNPAEKFRESLGELGKNMGFDELFKRYSEEQDKYIDKEMLSFRKKLYKGEGKFPLGESAEKAIVKLDAAQKKIKKTKAQEEELAKAIERQRAKSPLGKLQKNVLGFAKGIASTLKFVLVSGTKFMIVAMATITAIVLILKTVLPSILPALREAFKAIQPVLGFIKDSFGVFWEGLQKLWNGLFGGGTLGDALAGVMMIVGGLIGMALGVLGTLFGFIISFGKNLLEDIWGRAKDWFFNKWNSITTLKDKVIVILAIVGGIIAAILGAPVLIVAGIIAGLYVVFSAVINNIDTIKEKVQGILSKIGSIFGFAEGGVVKGDMQLVGEKGPELVSLPSGSRVHSNAASKQMIGSTTENNIVNNFSITINAQNTSDQEMRRIADKIAGMIDTRVKRRSSMG